MKLRVCRSFVCLTHLLASTAAASGAMPAPARRAAPATTSMALPVRFERNDGQTDARVKFVSRGRGYTLFLTAREMVLLSGGASRSAVRIEFRGAASDREIVGVGPVTGRSNYLIGADPRRWRSGVPGFGRVMYRELYPGIDLVVYGSGQRVEYDFIVAPGARPDAISMKVDGGDVSIDDDGDLRIATRSGVVNVSRPAVYQEIDGVRREVSGSYRLAGRGKVTFALGGYDRARPLVIDPVLDWSTYLGGSALDNVNDLAVDGAGDVYVAGWTQSLDFPTTAGVQPVSGGGFDGFVAKLKSDGSALVYATYVGGSGFENAEALTVDADGAVYVTGGTTSTNFPTVNAVQPALAGGPGGDAFVMKIDPAGASLVYSTYLGGSGSDGGSDIAVHADGSVSIGGVTNSLNFPLAQPVQASFAGGFLDLFVTRLSPAGNQLVHSTYLGGSGSDEGGAVAAAPGGGTLVAGSTQSHDFPIVAALQPSFGGGFTDGVYAMLTADGSALAFSSYLGGPDRDRVNDLAVDPDGGIVLTGFAGFGFPTVNAIQPFFAGGFTDMFVTRLDGAGLGPLFSTYLGGSGSDAAGTIVVDAARKLWIAGSTDSMDARVQQAVQPLPGGGTDAYVAGFTLDGAFEFGTYLGGADTESGTGLGVDSSGQVYVAGSTDSVDFPTARPLQPAYGGTSDGFVARISFANSRPIASAGDDQIAIAESRCRAVVMLDGSASFDPDGDPLTYTWSGTFGTVDGPQALLHLPVGIHVITLTVSDGRSESTDTVQVIVADSFFPIVESVSVTPSTLAPPNHLMVPVTVSVVATDVCDATVTCEIVEITSNEPLDDHGDGDTETDWDITGPLTARLRAERLAAGTGRVYTIVVRCTDPWGNSATRSLGTVAVTVPR